MATTETIREEDPFAKIVRGQSPSDESHSIIWDRQELFGVYRGDEIIGTFEGGSFDVSYGNEIRIAVGLETSGAETKDIELASNHGGEPLFEVKHLGRLPLSATKVQLVLEDLVAGQKTHDDDIEILNEQRRTFLLHFGGRVGLFDVDNINVLQKIDLDAEGNPKDRVLVYADTEKGREFVWLNVNERGEANFSVSDPTKSPEKQPADG